MSSDFGKIMEGFMNAQVEDIRNGNTTNPGVGFLNGVNTALELSCGDTLTPLPNPHMAGFRVTEALLEEAPSKSEAA